MTVFSIINTSDSSVTYQSQTILAGETFNVVNDAGAFAADYKLLADLIATRVMISIGPDSYSGETAVKLLMYITQKDLDGADIVRVKAARKGWTFSAIPIEFTTSRLQSSNLSSSDDLYSKDSNGVSRSFISLKLYDASDVEITSPGPAGVNYATAVKTVIDFEPPYDYEVIGGELRTLSTISSDLRLWLVAAPDIPAPLGSKEMGGGINLRYLSPGNVWSVDGRVAKYATYDPVNHTNKIRLIIKYPAGEVENLQIVIQLYKL